MVNWITIIIILAAAFIIYELVKHLFLRKFSKWIIILIILLMILFALSSFLDTTPLERSNNKIIATGASIFSDITNVVSNNIKQANLTLPSNEKS